MTDTQDPETTPCGKAWHAYLHNAVPCQMCGPAEAGKGCGDGRSLYGAFRLTGITPAVPNGKTERHRDPESGSEHMQYGVQASDGGEADSLPLDRETMRAAAARLLALDAEPPSCDELETLALLYRGNMMLLIPEVERATKGLSKDDAPRACAMACIGEARIRLDLHPGAGLPARIAHAQHLARSVNALLDHLESLEVPR
jgi:hypothetical protein